MIKKKRLFFIIGKKALSVKIFKYVLIDFPNIARKIS